MLTGSVLTARRLFEGLALASCTCLIHCKDPSGLDNYTYSQAVIRGTVTQENNVPVAGATVQIYAELRSTCQGTVLPYGELTTTTTDASGNYISRATIGPVSEQTGCVTVRIKAPAGLALDDAISDGVLVKMRADRPGSVPDTARIDVVIKKK